MDHRYSRHASAAGGVIPELDVHFESSETDPDGKRIGALTAIIAVFLAVVTILSHRAHTEAVVLKTEANDNWSFYQAKSLKSHGVAIGRDLITALQIDTAASRGLVSRYREEQARYEKESEEIKVEAKAKDKEAKGAERRALRYDLGEGLLEIGLVLSSLFFIARRLMFPWIGLIAAISGVGLALSSLLI